MTMTKKIAVVTDSNSGITQSQAKECGLYVLPMPFMINEEPFYEDITLTQEQFYRRLSENADVITSQPIKFWMQGSYLPAFPGRCDEAVGRAACFL